jgi:hypothetical protein
MTRIVLSAFSIAVGILGVQSVIAQSTLPDFPTPVSSNEISGAIKARDVGDSRLTTYYYWFEGSQGDMFVNLVTKNFAGDVDLFIQSGLRPLTKIVIYPDFGEAETGRVIYLRKPEKLVLRVQGRTPNDEPAQFRVKFAGSFVAVKGTGTDEPEIPKVIGETVGSVRVNSVGTIIPPPPRPVKVDTESAAVDPDKSEAKEKPKSETETLAERSDTTETKPVPKVEVVVTDDTLKKSTATKSIAPPRRTRNARVPPKKVTPPETPVSETREKKENEVDPAENEAKTAATETNADPLANVQLVILFKDGRRIERPLTEVARFSVDRGVLTVIAKGGRIGKYSMVDVSKVTIE